MIDVRTEKRTGGAIVAKDTTKNVQAILDLGDAIAVSHHEGLSSSPGGITVRRLSDFRVVRKAKGAFGRILPMGDVWLAQGPLFRGCAASTAVLDPASLERVALLPVVPLAVLDDHRFVASTPPRALVMNEGGVEPGAIEADPKIVAASWLVPPLPGGLVEVDRKKREVRLLVEGRAFDDFRFAATSPSREVVYAATSFGWTVALRVADRSILWERPPVENCVEWSGGAFALDPTGAFFACAGSGLGVDLRVLDTKRGEVEAQVKLCAMLDRARIVKAKNARVEALAFHPSGWLAASTNAGVVAELTPRGDVSAFKASLRGVDAMCFVERGTKLVVGGREANLRVWPI